MVVYPSILSSEQTAAIVEAKNSLQGKSKISVREMPPLEQLVNALRNFDGNIFFLSLGDDIEKTKEYAQSSEGKLLMEFAQGALVLVLPQKEIRNALKQVLPKIPVSFIPKMREGSEHYAEGIYTEYVVATLVERVEDATIQNKENLIFIAPSGWINTALATALVLTGGMVENGDWNGKVASCSAVVIVAPDREIRHVSQLSHRDVHSCG
jgi:hypothetical protein